MYYSEFNSQEYMYWKLKVLQLMIVMYSFRIFLLLKSIPSVLSITPKPSVVNNVNDGHMT